MPAEGENAIAGTPNPVYCRSGGIARVAGQYLEFAVRAARPG
jgi:hypothetical protein